MVPEQLSQLLTAYIDGELSSRRRRAVQRLLRKSREARKLLLRLKEDSRSLRRLSRSHLEQDLAPRVLRAISDRRLNVTRRAALVQRPPFPAWAGYAAAAAVLFAVFCGSYLYFYAAQYGVLPTNNNVAQHKNGSPTEKRPTPANSSAIAPDRVAENSTEPEKKNEPVNPIVEPEKKKNEPARVAVEKTPSTPQTPISKKTDPNDSAVGRKVSRPTVFDDVKTRVVFNIALRELETADNQQRLRSELDKDNAFRFELTFKRPNAFERLEAAFKANSIHLLIDHVAQTRLKNGQKSSYVLFFEDVTPEEVAKIMATIGTQDKADGQFGQVFIQSLTEADHKEVANLLGIDPTKLGPAPRGPLGVDLRKPLSETTARQVSKTLTGQGPGRTDAGKPAGNMRQAIVLAYSPGRTPKASREIQQFLESRVPRRQGTVQVLLVLRNNNG